MKALKTLLLAGIAAVGVATSASAVGLSGTHIYLTGSTAFRAATQTTISDILKPGYTYAFSDSASLQKSTSSIFVGTLKSNNDAVVIKATFTGSLAGIQSVASNLTVNFIPDSATTSTTGTANSTSVTDPEVPTFTMADSFQSSTPFQGTNSITGTKVTYKTLTDNTVGIVPFVFVASNGSGITNITDDQFQQLYSNGSIPLSFFTGNHADESVNVFAGGRNFDSGTRLGALSDTGYGVNTLVTQYFPTISGSTITAFTPYPAASVDGVSLPLGDGGEASGGTLAGFLNKSSTRSIGYLIGYLGITDAATATSGTTPGTILTYNSVAYGTPSAGPQASSPVSVAEGQYAFWGFEHLDTVPGITGDSFQASEDLVNDLSTVTANTSGAGIFLGDVNVFRNTDGAPVFPNPTY